ncbi:MAG: glycosylase [Clostridiales bacterium]|jgi:maltose alpha-D-glucosyltransferase/alpha-amylase|nr:glycosylase [Clostridiales bacterium]
MKYDWLESAVFYEVYPTSFYDSNGDGVGDIAGIIQKLDYIKELGANGIWLNPCFESPFGDGGYDVSDYCKVDGRFGTNADMEELFAEAKKRGIKIILDLVMGHTSITHPWFRASQKDEKNQYTDAYIWKDFSNPAEIRDGQFLGGMSEREGMFRVNYYAIQPALNYGYLKPKARWQQAMDAEAPMKNRQRLIDVCKFWLGMGASGFRVDMANYMVKDDPKREGNIAFWNDVIPKIKQEYPESIFVSEWFNSRQSVKKSAFDIDFTGGYFLYSVWPGNDPAERENFSKNAYLGENAKRFFSGIVQIYSAAKNVKSKGYQAITLGNHDRERASLGRSFDQLKAAFAFHLTMPHVPFIYYGDEVGMSYNTTVKSKDGGYKRTGSRTPMQWSNQKNRGFSAAEPSALYLPTESDPARCVEAQAGADGSLYETVKKLVALRRKLRSLRADGGFKLLSLNVSGLPFIYKRVSDADETVVILYPKKQAASFSVKKLGDLSRYDIISNNIEFKDGKAMVSGEAFAVLYRVF